MSGKKIRVLMHPSDGVGVGHFRNIWPAQEMEKLFSDEFTVEINLEFVNDINYYKQFDIVHFHRQLGPYEQMSQLVSDLRKNGVITVMDIDDYWNPPKTHPMYMMAVKEKIGEKITNAFSLVDYVSTTTQIYANYIRKYNKNVVIIPNGIDMNHKMWQYENTKKNDKVRISWIGGSSHKADLDLLKTSMNMLHNDKGLKDKYSIVMCGYDTRGFISEIGPDGNIVQTRKILPTETIWNKFEEIMTDNYNPSIVSEDYKKYLLRCENKEFKGFDVYESSYVRRWTLPLTRYGEHYNYCDVCLAPLEDNIFNEVKSELKIIESGLKKKALIAQDYGIYSQIIKNGVNGILISKSEGAKGGWYKAIKRLIEDTEYREMLAQNLYDTVKDTYTLEVVTRNRVDFYKEIVRKRDESKELLSAPTGTAEAVAYAMNFKP